MLNWFVVCYFVLGVISFACYTRFVIWCVDGVFFVWVADFVCFGVCIGGLVVCFWVCFVPELVVTTCFNLVGFSLGVCWGCCFALWVVWVLMRWLFAFKLFCIWLVFYLVLWVWVIVVYVDCGFVCGCLLGLWV